MKVVSNFLLVPLATLCFWNSGNNAALAAPSSSAPVVLPSWRFDMGPAAPAAQASVAPDGTPQLEAGFIAVDRGVTFNEQRGFGWIRPPISTYDHPQAYPPSALERDGVATSPDGAVFAVTLPAGKYRVTVHLGVLPPFEWRPGMYVKVGDEYKVRGLTAGGNVAAPQFDLESPGGRVEFTFGAVLGGVGRTCSVAGLQIVPEQQARQEAARYPRSVPVARAVKWIENEGIRGSYGGPLVPAFDEVSARTRNGTRQFQDAFVKAGMNAYMAGFRSNDNALTQWSRWAKSNRVHLFDISKFANGPEYADVRDQMRKSVYWDGREDITPCPLEEKAWQHMMVDQALDAIRVAKAGGGQLDGLLIDAEMYGAKVAEVYNNLACYCGHCVTSFGKGTNTSLEATSGKAAYEELVSRGLLPRYLRFQEDKLTGILQAGAAKIRKADPNFLLGFLQWKPQNWFLRALVRGLGAPGLPTLVFGEDTYSGYNNDALSMRRKFAEMGAQALYVPGLWYNQFSPAGLRDSIRLTRTDSGHFWLYGHAHIYEVQNAADKPAPGRSLPHSYLSRPAAEYWAALKDGIAKNGPVLAANEPANREPRDWVAQVSAPPQPDAHNSNLVPLPSVKSPVWLFDMGTANSPVAPGHIGVTYNTLYNAQRRYGWYARVSGSYDREAAKPLDPLTRDGLLVGTENTFRADVPNGRYEVSVILGDMSPTEPRPFQNVTINGQHLVVDKLSNGGEYRVFTFPVEVKDGKLEFLCHGIGGERTAVMGILIGKA